MSASPGAHPLAVPLLSSPPTSMQSLPPSYALSRANTPDGTRDGSLVEEHGDDATGADRRNIGTRPPIPSDQTDSSGNSYPWKVKREDRYPPKDPTKYTELEKRYPPDRFGEEASENARVWRLYRDRVSERDDDQIEGWNKTLDILLIFAGLFSAVATAFVIEAQKNLQQDYFKYVANATFIYFSRSDTTAPVHGLLPPNDFQRPPVARTVNALWFLSLSLALIVALLAILAKQWLGEYTRRMRNHVASHRRWVWRHLVFNAGLDKWGMNVFISALPVLLHAALFLFLLGLIVYLAELDWVSAGVVLVPTSFTMALYVFTSFAPLWYGDCPTATPLLRQGHLLVEKFWTMGHWLALRIGTIFRREQFEQGDMPGKWDPPAYYEDELLRGKEAHRDAAALSWMLKSLPALDEVAIVQEAIGSLDILEHYVAFHEHNDVGLVTPRADDPLCQPDQRRLIINRLGRMNTAYSLDVGEMARCIRSVMFAGPLSAKDTDRLLLVMKQGTASTHDLHSFIRILQPKYATPLPPDRLRLWLRGNTPGPPPILKSSMAILFHSGDVPRTTEQAAVVANFCDLVMPLISDHGNEGFVARRAAVAFMVHHFQRWILPSPVGNIEVLKNPDELRLLVLDTLFAIAGSPTTDAISDEAKSMASVVVLRLVAEANAKRVPANRSDGINHAICYVSSNTPQGSAESELLDDMRIKQFVCSFLGFNCRCGSWSAALGRLLHCSAIRLGNLDWMARRFFADWPAEDCRNIAQVLGERYSTGTLATLESKANLLILDASDLSWWDLFWEQYVVSDEHFDAMPVATDLVVHLCLLMRSDANVDELAHTLLGADRGLEIALRGLSDMSRVVKFIQHAKEIAPQWWRQTQEMLESLPHLDRRYQQFELWGTTPRNFSQRMADVGISHPLVPATAPRTQGGLGLIRQSIRPRIRAAHADNPQATEVAEQEGLLEMGLRSG